MIFSVPRFARASQHHVGLLIMVSGRSKPISPSKVTLLYYWQQAQTRPCKKSILCPWRTRLSFSNLEREDKNLVACKALETFAWLLIVDHHCYVSIAPCTTANMKRHPGVFSGTKGHPGVFSGTKRHPGVFSGIAKDIFSLSQKVIFSFYQLVVKMFLFQITITMIEVWMLILLL